MGPHSEFELLFLIVSLQTGKMYTLIVAYTTANMPGLGTHKRPIILWLTVNGMSPAVSNGNQVIAYSKPHSPGLFLFLVYEQKKKVEVNPMAYGKDCNMKGVEGARYDVQYFQFNCL